MFFVVITLNRSCFLPDQNKLQLKPLIINRRIFYQEQILISFLISLSLISVITLNIFIEYITNVINTCHLIIFYSSVYIKKNIHIKKGMLYINTPHLIISKIIIIRIVRLYYHSHLYQYFQPKVLLVIPAYALLYQLLEQ